ncbi:site-specific integrase, partial [Vibrio anguillarum]|nr:site-specific integrase [Vibrio anguillarum]
MRINEVATLSLDVLKTAIRLAESKHRYELTISPQLNGVQTKYAKRRTIEISAELLTQLDDYRISERRLQRVKKLNNKLDNLFE